MPLVRRAIDNPGATLAAAVGAMVCAVSLVASQHVGVNFVTGFDFESLEADVEFSAAATDAQKRQFMAMLEATLAATDARYGHRNLNGWVTKQNQAQFNREQQTGVQYASIEAPYAFSETRTVAPRLFAKAPGDVA